MPGFCGKKPQDIVTTIWSHPLKYSIQPMINVPNEAYVAICNGSLYLSCGGTWKPTKNRYSRRDLWDIITSVMLSLCRYRNDICTTILQKRPQSSMDRDILPDGINPFQSCPNIHCWLRVRNIFIWGHKPATFVWLVYLTGSVKRTVLLYGDTEEFFLFDWHM